MIRLSRDRERMSNGHMVNAIVVQDIIIMLKQTFQVYIVEDRYILEVS